MLVLKQYIKIVNNFEICNLLYKNITKNKIAAYLLFKKKYIKFNVLIILHYTKFSNLIFYIKKHKLSFIYLREVDLYKKCKF